MFKLTLPLLKSCVDEIVIVDMGSNDGSIETFSELLSKKDKIIHYDRKCLFQFGFGHPRNYGAKFATSEFILAIDADEALFPDEFNPAWNAMDKRMRVFAANGRNYMNPNHDVLEEFSEETAALYEYSTQPCPRIYLNDPFIRYEGIIHEAIWDRDRRGYDISPPFVSADIHHLAEFKPSRGQPQKKFDLYAYLMIKAHVYPGFQMYGWDPGAIDRDRDNLFKRANAFAIENGLSGFEWSQVYGGKPLVIT